MNNKMIVAGLITLALHALPVSAAVATVSPSTPNVRPSGRVTGDAKLSGACMKIAEACKSAGFIPGDWKKGDGLWRDCVDPIVQGKTVVPGATKSLPNVDAATVTECKTKRPKFGTGQVGS